MNDQPPPSRFKLSGAPPTEMTGLRRLSPWARVMMTGGALTAVALYGLQVGLPDGWRPSSVAGDAAGDTVRHEIEAMKEAKMTNALHVTKNGASALDFLRRHGEYENAPWHNTLPASSMVPGRVKSIGCMGY